MVMMKSTLLFLAISMTEESFDEMEEEESNIVAKLDARFAMPSVSDPAFWKSEINVRKRLSSSQDPGGTQLLPPWATKELLLLEIK